MKTKILLFLSMILVLTMITACGGEAPPAPPTQAPDEVPAEPTPASAEEPTVVVEPTQVPPTQAPTEMPTKPAPAAPEFPMPDDASNVMMVGEGVTTFRTALSLPDVVTFYRFAFPELTEREALTEFSENAFQLVFDGHESGKSVIVHGFPLGDGMVNVSIRLGDM